MLALRKPGNETQDRLNTLHEWLSLNPFFRPASVLTMLAMHWCRSAIGSLLLAGAVLAHAGPEPAKSAEFAKSAAPAEPAEPAEPDELASSISDLYRDALLAISDGRLEDAQKALAALSAAEPRHAGVWLDLAMLYCAAGNATAADRLFTEIERRFAPPPPILEVMARQRQLGCTGGRLTSDLTLRLGRGFASNVNQGASNPNFSFSSGPGQVDLVLLPEYLPRGDRFTEFSGEFFREFSAGGAVGVLQFQSRQYDRLSGYDYSSLYLGAELPWHWGRWGLRAVGSTGLMTLGQQIYQRKNQLQLELAPPLPLPAYWHFGMAGIWSASSYPGLNGLDAQWWETRVTLAYRKNDLWLQTSASAVRDRARGQRPGGDRAGMLAGVQGRMNFGHGVLGELGWQVQDWRESRPYFPGVIDVRRIQKTTILRAAAVFPLNAEHAAVLEFRNTRNQENISLFDYSARTLQLNWQWQPGKKY